MMDERERLRVFFRIFGAKQCRGRSPVYEALSEAAAGSDDLLDLVVDSAASDQRRPSLLFAAVNLLLASHPEAELTAYYPVHGGHRPPDGRLAPAFFAFCAEHREELARFLREGSTQTNEIRRCVALRLGLSHAEGRWPGSFSLVEVGASAGLNLLFDRYRYRLNGQEAGPVTDSPVTVSCEVRDGAGHGGAGQFGGDAGQFLATVPGITSRLGIDLQPVDVADPGSRAWLEAFVWPEQADDLATLRDAIGLAVADRATPQAAHQPADPAVAVRTVVGPAVAVVRGDATADLATLIRALPGSEPVAVFTASLLSYLGPAARRAFADQLDEAAGYRRIAWIFAETPGLLAAAGVNTRALDGPLARRNSCYLIGASMRSAGYREDALLALADPYLRWLAPARHPADDFEWVESPA
jgi:hypothetical protein